MAKITQLTQEQAVACAETRQWKSWDAKTRAMFQFNQKYLCMPFDVFHKATEDALGRPVFTHEFGLNPDGLLSELQGIKEAPTFEQIMLLLPPNKTIVISV
jgi:hypothetical protein